MSSVVELTIASEVRNLQVIELSEQLTDVTLGMFFIRTC